MPLARLGAVRNAGVQLADSRWVGFLDGDDVWHPRRLELQKLAIVTNPEAKFIGADYVFIDAEGRAFAYSNGSTPAPSSWLVDRQLMLEHPFDPSLTVGEDYFWLRQTKGVCIRVRVPQVLISYRIRGSSISALQHGTSRQRRIREAMARAASVPLLRYPMLACTYLRYLAHRRRPYDV
jgi:glycosyltransferase involved in cell wall biosynthesis